MTITTSYLTIGRIFRLLFCFAALQPIILISGALAQDKCATAFTEAEKMYQLGRFTQAIDLLNQCLPNGIPEIERTRAYRILALCFIAKDYLDEAQYAIQNLLNLDKNYQTDPVQDPQQFIELVDKVKHQPVKMKAPPKNNASSGIQYKGGVVIVALVVVSFLIYQLIGP